MKTRFTRILVLMVLMVSSGSVATPKTIRVGGEIDYPPYCFLDEDGHPSGFQVDLTLAIAKVMGMDVEIDLTVWAETRRRLEDGSIDIICGMFYSDERAKLYDFSPPYTIVSSAIFARRGSPPVQSIHDLRDKELIVVRGEAMHDLVVRENITQKLVLAETPEDVIKRLASGTGDYALGALMPGLYWIEKLGLSNVTTMGKPLEPFQNCFSVRKGNTLLLSRFTEGLLILHQTGEYQKLYQKWFGFFDAPGVSLKKVVKYATAIFLPLLVLLVTAVVWSWTLRRTVTRRTLELSDSRQQLYTLSDNLPNGYVFQLLLSGEQRRFTYISAGVEKMYGVSAKEVLANPRLFYKQIVEEDRQLIAVQEALAQERLTGIYAEVRYQTPSGEKRWQLITASPRKLPDQRIAADGLAIDITERKRAEEAQTRLVQEWKTTFDSVNDAVWLLDIDQRIMRTNRTAENLFGYPAEAMLGKYCWEIVHGTREPVPECPVMRMRQSLRRETMELLIDARVYCITVDPILNAEGKLTGAVHVVSDITRRKQTEEALKASEERLNMAMMVKNEGIWDWNLVTNKTEFDDRYYTMAGYAAGEFPQTFTAWASHVHPDDLVATDSAVKAYLAGESDRFDVEFRWKRKDGSWMWINGRGKIVERDETGKPKRMVGTHTDITDRKRAEEELQLRERRFSQMIQNSYDTIAIIDADGIQRYVSPSAEQVHGYAPAELVDIPVFEKMIHPDDRAHVRAAFRSIIETGTGGAQYRHCRKDGGWVYLEARGTNQLNNPDIRGVVINVRDITEQKREECYRTLTAEILELLNQPAALQDSFRAVLAAIRKNTGCEAAGIRLLNGEDFPYFVQNGFSSDFLLTENTLIDRDPQGGICRGPDGKVCLTCTCGLVISGQTDPSNPLFTPGGSA